MYYRNILLFGGVQVACDHACVVKAPLIRVAHIAADRHMCTLLQMGQP